MFLPATNILKFSKIVHIINLFDRFIIIIIIIIITIIIIIIIITSFYLFIYLWNNHYRKMKRYQAGIYSINQVREGAFT